MFYCFLLLTFSLNNAQRRPAYLKRLAQLGGIHSPALSQSKSKSYDDFFASFPSFATNTRVAVPESRANTSNVEVNHGDPSHQTGRLSTHINVDDTTNAQASSCSSFSPTVGIVMLQPDV